MPAGRKTKINEQMIKNAATHIRNCLSIEAVCKKLGIHKDTYYDWMKKGEKRKGSIYEKFRIEVENAHADAEAKLLEIVQVQAMMDWRAAAWILERRFEQWRNNKIDTSVEMKPLKIEVVKSK